MKVDVKNLSVPYEFHRPDGAVLFYVEEANLSYEHHDGEMSSEVTRFNFERGDGVGVIPYIEETDEVILVEQFRYPVYTGRAPSTTNKGWIMEIVAGIVDDEGEVVAERELLEETGYKLAGPLELLSTFYLSPGGSSESMQLFLAPVTKREDADRHAGLQAESEDIRIHIQGLDNALKLIEIGHIQDAKTIIALLMLKGRGVSHEMIEI
jgi:nudix-type nucleoside diphosphatase (YffH/AdpP family)